MESYRIGSRKKVGTPLHAGGGMKFVLCKVTRVCHVTCEEGSQRLWCENVVESVADQRMDWKYSRLAVGRGEMALCQ